MKREQSAVGFDAENKRFCERHTAITGESMADLVNKLLKEYREAHEETTRNTDGSMISAAITARNRQAEIEDAIRRYLKENDFVLYMAKKQKKTTKNDLLKLKNELFFSKYKVDTTIEVIKVILRDEIEKFDVEDYEKKKGLKPARSK